MPRETSSASAPAAVLEPFLRLVASVIVFNQQVAERLGMGMTDMQFMTHLQREGAITPGRLAQLTDLSSGTVSGVLERLEAAGYVRRERDPGDRRKVLVHLDEARVGRDVAPLYGRQGAHLAAVVDGFYAAEQGVIVRFLEALVATGPTTDATSEAEMGRFRT
jgi:DNA-binding transcriptional ArsR family regulator